MDKSARRKPKKQKNHLKKRFFIFATLALLLVVGSYFSEHLCPYDPYEQNLSIAKASPSLAHPFGTDRYGRDMLSRVIVGSKTSIYSTLLLPLLRNKGHKKAAFLFSHVESKKRRFCVVFSF